MILLEGDREMIKGFMTSRKEKNKSRIYIFHTDESPIENLNNRRFRQNQIYRKEVLPELFQKLGISGKVVWSQKAGCKCGCSPGFIFQDESYDKDVFVDV